MKINIIVDEDNCWNLNTVRRLVVSLNKKNIFIDNIWILPNKLSSLYKNKISFWYLKTFGLMIFSKLALFYIIVILNNFRLRINNFKALCKKYDLNFKYISSLNANEFLKHLNKNEEKIFLLITNHILKKNNFYNKKNIFINKHSSLLPSYRGLMPYIWTKIYDDKNGVTFHLVNNKIDSGEILFQKIYDKNFNSMIDFYLYIFENFPDNFIQAIYNFRKKKYFKSNYNQSYFSLPTKYEFDEFKKKGGKIILFSDFFKINKITK